MQHPRINVVVNEEVLNMLNFLAEYEHKSVSLVARELIEDSLERREDQILSEMALRREMENTRLLSHQKAWNEV